MKSPKTKKINNRINYKLLIRLKLVVKASGAVFSACVFFGFFPPQVADVCARKTKATTVTPNIIKSLSVAFPEPVFFFFFFLLLCRSVMEWHELQIIVMYPLMRKNVIWSCWTLSLIDKGERSPEMIQMALAHAAECRRKKAGFSILLLRST